MKILLALLALLLLGMFIWLARGRNLLVSTNMNKKINLENSLVVDVRTREEFDAGHDEASVNIPLSDIEAGKLDVFKNSDKENIILVCRSGGRAGTAESILKTSGIAKNIYNLGPWQNIQQLR
jgi:rhodanese-related sulfurtransferase